jgi:hypothetical protein
VENIDQGTSRDILTEIMLRQDEEGRLTTLHVYDQVSVSGSADAFDAFGRAMVVNPFWAKGLPLDAEATTLPRWAKNPKPPMKDILFTGVR